MVTKSISTSVGNLPLWPTPKRDAHFFVFFPAAFVFQPPAFFNNVKYNKAIFTILNIVNIFTAAQTHICMLIFSKMNLVNWADLVATLD